MIQCCKKSALEGCKIGTSAKFEESPFELITVLFSYVLLFGPKLNYNTPGECKPKRNNMKVTVHLLERHNGFYKEDQ